MKTNKNEIREIFDIWVSSKKSEATKESYRRVVPQFFRLMFDKNVESIDQYDLLSIKPASVQELYLNKLESDGYKHNTIRNYLDIVSSFFNYMDANNVFDVNYKFITEIALAGRSLREDNSRRELLSETQYNKLYNWLMEKEFSARYGNLGEKYALVLELMWSTAIRIDSVFTKVTWSDIVWEKDSVGNSSWVIYALDKGDKVNRKPINEALYTKLREVFYQGDETELVLKGVSKQSFTRLMKEYSDEFGVKVTPHSIKVGAGTKLYAMTKDIVLTSRFLDHSDTKVTERYIRTDEDITNTGSYIMTTPIDDNQLYGLSLNQLQDILRSRADLGRAVLLEAKKNNLIA